MKKIDNFVPFLLVVALLILPSCASTQKTGGGGLISVVAQNVVRIAGVQAMKGADLSILKDRLTYVKTTGFVDDRNEKFIDNLVRSRAEAAGAKLVREDKAQVVLEVVVNSAGNDQGRSKVPLVMRSERTEGSVDLDLIARDVNNGSRLSTQQVRGEAKYQQSTVIGFQGSGEYYVKNSTGHFDLVKDPSSFR